jgi:hypothetical protein
MMESLELDRAHEVGLKRMPLLSDIGQHCSCYIQEAGPRNLNMDHPR